MLPRLKDSRALALFGKNPSNMTQLVRKNPSIPQHCLKALGTHYAYDTRVLDTKHKLTGAGIYEYKQARLHL